MTLSPLEINLSPDIQVAASGRFFNGCAGEVSMFTLSQTVFLDNANLLQDDRGMILQYPVHDVETPVESGLPVAPAVHSLALDGSRYSLGELAWRYVVALPHIGRTVKDLYITPRSLEATTLVYDQQGALKHKDSDSDSDTSILAQRIQAVVDGPIFKQRVREVASTRAEAEESFEQFMAELITRGADLKRMKSVIDKREATVKRRGFVACSAIVRS